MNRRITTSQGHYRPDRTNESPAPSKPNKTRFQQSCTHDSLDSVTRCLSAPLRRERRRVKRELRTRTHGEGGRANLSPKPEGQQEGSTQRPPPKALLSSWPFPFVRPSRDNGRLSVTQGLTQFHPADGEGWRTAHGGGVIGTSRPSSHPRDPSL